MKRLVTLGVAGLVLTGFAGMTTLSASALNNQPARTGTDTQARHYGSQGNGRMSSLSARAEMLGMSVAELEKALETKTMSQIAVDKGMTEAEFEAKMKAIATARWKSRGFSKEEITERLAERQKRHDTNRADHEFGSGDGDHQGGYGQHRQR